MMRQLKYGIVLSLLLILFLVSCKKENVVETPARNVFTGVADGVSFSNTSATLYKDTADRFTFIGNAGAGSLIAVVNGKDLGEYPVADGDVLNNVLSIDSTNTLDSLAVINVISSIQDAIINLPAGQSFAFLIRRNSLLFSNRGSIILENYNGATNRLFGEFDVELINIEEGTRYLQASFDDVFYNDCAELGICLF